MIIGRYVRVWSIILETPLATLEKLYEMVDKAPKLPTSSVNENVHSNHYKLKEELKMSEIVSFSRREAQVWNLGMFFCM